MKIKDDIQIVKLKVGEVMFKIEFIKGENFYACGFWRNKKCLLSSTYPKIYKSQIKMDIFRELSEHVSWELKHAIEKIIIK